MNCGRSELEYAIVTPERSSRAGALISLQAAKATQNGTAAKDADQLSILIADIYDAAADSSRWPTALKKLCRYIPGCHADIFIQNVAPDSREIVFTADDDGEHRRLDCGCHDGAGRLFPALLSRPVGELVSISDLEAAVQFRDARFHKQRSQGLADATGAVLERLETSYAALAVTRDRSQGTIDGAGRERMRRVVPHVRRAILMGKTIDLQKAETAAYEDAFDALTAAIYLVDSGGCIMHANRSGATLLADSEIVTRRDGRLHALDPHADRTLQGILVAAKTADETAFGPKGATFLMISRDGARYAAHVLPLLKGNLRKPRPGHAAAIGIFVQRACMHRPGVADALAERFRLTPTELRVLFGVVEIGGAPDVARVLGMAEGTVKTHLKRVFLKTGISRQADLVKIVAEFASLAI